MYPSMVIDKKFSVVWKQAGDNEIAGTHLPEVMPGSQLDEGLRQSQPSKSNGSMVPDGIVV